MGAIESMEHCCSDRSPKKSSESTQMTPSTKPQRLESSSTARTQCYADVDQGEGRERDLNIPSIYMVSATHGTRGTGSSRRDVHWADELGQTSSFVTSDSSEGNLLQHLKVVPCGVLGKNVEGHTVLVEPKEDTVVVDSAGMACIKGGLSLMPLADLEAKISTYRWLGIRAEFPHSVRDGITAPMSAKYYEYGVSGDRKCIHVVGPDFRSKGNSFEVQRDAVASLAEAYHNVFAEFCASDAKHLRLAPISEGTCSGGLKEQMPDITAEALKLGFQRLSPEHQQFILECQVEMCISSKSSAARFVQALECSTNVAPSKL